MNPRDKSRQVTGLIIKYWQLNKLASLALPSQSTLLVEGPVTFTLQNGDASVLAAPLVRDLRSIIAHEQAVPVETVQGCLIEVRLAPGGKYRIVNESTIPTGWREASQIIRQVKGVAVILGDVDSGKSTLCTFLANECFRDGIPVSIIDGDVGQADIGPPTTISSSVLRHHVFSLREVKPDTSLFMGDTSPTLIPEKLTRGLVRLRDLAKSQSEVTLINTDGWVRSEDAVAYKVQLLGEVRPNLVLVIDGNGEVDPIVEQQASTTLKLARSKYAITRTREARRRYRESGYKRFLENAKRLDLPLGKVRLRRFNSYSQMKIREEENLKSLLAGLLDQDEKLMAIARVENLHNGMVNVKTALHGFPRIVELGAVLLSPRYKELGYDS